MPRRFTDITASKSSAVRSGSRANEPEMPAFRWYRSTRPNRRTASSSQASVSASLAMLPPVPADSVASDPATWRAASASRSATTTWTPSWASRMALARPMPWPPPVTMATLPSSPRMTLPSDPPPRRHDSTTTSS